MSERSGVPVLTIGETLVEIMATEAGDGFRAPMPLVGPFASGAPAIFIDQVAKLGHPALFVSAVGDDDFGRLCRDRLAADGVDVSAIAIDGDRPTGSAFVRYRLDGGRDFIFNIRHSACASIGDNDATQAAIERAGHLHIMGTALASEGMLALTLKALERIKAKGGSISFDPNFRRELPPVAGLREALGQILAASDVFLPSGDELFLFTEARDEAGAIAELLARGLKTVVVKRGAAGASAFEAGGRTDVAGYAVDEIDPTGAGDCFGATFVVAWLRGLPIAEALALANAAGALAVTRKGPMEGNSTMADLTKFRAGQP
jgi:tagatose kinase